jgi:hypothetical protein
MGKDQGAGTGDQKAPAIVEGKGAHLADALRLTYGPVSSAGASSQKRPRAASFFSNTPHLTGFRLELESILLRVWAVK